MTPGEWSEVKRCFEKAMEMSRGDREQFLKTQPPAIRDEVSRLFGELDEAGDFLSEPIWHAQGLLGDTGLRFAPGEVILDRFEIRALLGVGGMGEVYEAYDRQLNERVAIKTMLPSLRFEKQFVDLFRTEVRRARRITHPNVCRIHELFEQTGEAGRLFFTMELIDGQSLLARLRDQGRISPLEARDIARQIAAGLDAAHRAGLVHRDLKPANVLLTQQGRAVITDFGLAMPSLRGTNESTPGSAQELSSGGTLRYQAPEQLDGAPASTAADIYALGLVLYELVTGAFPFDSSSPMLEITRRLTTNPVPPSQRVNDLPVGWNRAILACLERDPARRPRTTPEVIGLLEGSGREVARHWMKRRPARRHLLLAGIGAGGLAFWWRSRTTAPPQQRFVVLADPVGLKDAPHYASALRQAILTGLESSPNLRPYPGWRVRAAQALLGHDASDPVSSELAHAVAARDRVQYVGTGLVRLDGNNVVLQFQIEQAGTGGVVARGSESSGVEDGLAAAADRLVREIRRQAGDLESAIAATAPLERVTTKSFIALSRLSEGLRYYEEGKNDQALALFRSAAEIDPEFAMAYEYQALVYSSAGQEQIGFPLAAKAHALRLRATERERLQIDALRDVFEGNYEKSLEAYRSLIALYPDEPRVLRQLAHQYSLAGRLEEASAAARQAQALEPKPLARAAYALTLAQEGQLDAVDQLTRGAAAADGRLLGWAEGLVAMQRGDIAKANAGFQRFSEIVGQQSHAALFQAGARLLSGNWREALEMVQASAESALVRQDHLYESRHHHLAGWIAIALQERATAEPHAAKLAALPAEPWNLDGLRFAAHVGWGTDGKWTDVAAAKLDEVRRNHPGSRAQAFWSEAQGLLLWRRGNVEEGRALLRQADALWPDSWSAWWLGRVLAAAGSYTAAIVPLERLVRRPGQAFRWHATAVWMEAHLWLARCSNGKDAQQWYDRYLALGRGQSSFPRSREAAAERSKTGTKNTN